VTKSDPKLSDDAQSVLGGLLASPQKWNQSVGGKYWVSVLNLKKLKKRQPITEAQKLHMQKSFCVK
jgi:hypothetical protein